MPAGEAQTETDARGVSTDEKDAREERMEADRLFPMMGGPPIPWTLAERIYLDLYVACFGECQSFTRIAERGGFHYDEILAMAKRLAYVRERDAKGR
jgi:hypothetical protein